jgi:hypothetical protein
MLVKVHRSKSGFKVWLPAAMAAAVVLATLGVAGASAAPISGQSYSVLGDKKPAPVPEQDHLGDQPITRGELSQWLSVAARLREDPGPQLYQDVAPGSQYYAYINRITNRGIVGGYACGGPGEPCVEPGNLPYFRPGSFALRAQAAKMISNLAGFNDTPTGQTFEDVAPGNPLYLWVQRLASRGAAQGYRCGQRPEEPCVAPNNRPYFRPYDNITKADVILMLLRTFGNDGRGSE